MMGLTPRDTTRLLIWLSFLLTKSVSFQVPRPYSLLSHQQPAFLNTLLGARADVISSETDVLPGVQSMESWLKSDPPASWDSNVKHAQFGRLRGLQWTGKDIIKGPITAATIPASKTLCTSFNNDNWDVDLAIKLIKEYRKREDSNLAGYIDFLTEGNKSTLAPTAPFALRHWTSVQRGLLETSPKGRRLLELHEKQQQRWKELYENCGEPASFDEFSWAMETVLSRAFRGQRLAGNTLLAFLPTILAAVVGTMYINGQADPSFGILCALSLVAAAPIVLNREESVVCLLPFIDSANHSEAANSKIEYDPLTKSFQLCIGSECVDADTKQLFVSYGSRTDEEWIINYGFLPGLSLLSTAESYPQELAEEYIRRSRI